MKEISDKDLLKQLELRRDRKLEELRKLDIAVVAMGGEAVLAAPAPVRTRRPRPKAQPRSKPLAKTKAKPAEKPETKAKPKPQPKPKAKPEPKAKPKAKAKPSPKPEAKAKPKPKAKSKAKATTWTEKINAALQAIGEGDVQQVATQVVSMFPDTDPDKAKRVATLTLAGMARRGQLTMKREGDVKRYALA